VNRVTTPLIWVAIAFVSSLALARIHPFGDARLNEAPGVQMPILNNSQVPSEVRLILVEKCANCHSNQVHAPFYRRFAPFSWLMERDIVEARKAMNFSLWNTYSADRRQALEAKIVHEARSDEMPPMQYRLMHWDARTADADLRIFDHWAHGPQLIQVGAAVAGEADPERGKALFEKRCTGCHSMTRNREGPQLQGVYGRTSGTAAGYAYSPALTKAHIVWDEESLNKWLTDPDAFIPGNDMDFLVSKPQERRDLISYLKRSSGK
jgi:cytochrome c